MKLKDLTGQKFGRLTVLEVVHKKPRKNGGNIYYWRCRCDCGNICVVTGKNLKNGNTRSCGCLHGQNHGLCHTKIYNTWHGIKRRCYGINRLDYKHYGGRGITMFPAWINDFQAFYDYVSKLPHFNEEGYTLDRIDNNGNYEPCNIRWADAKEQARNRCSNHIIEYNGEQMTLAEAAEKSGLDYRVLMTRMHRGDSGDYLFRPVRKHK